MGNLLCSAACQEAENETEQVLKRLIAVAMHDLKKDILDCIKAEISKSQTPTSSVNNLPAPDPLKRDPN